MRKHTWVRAHSFFSACNCFYTKRRVHASKDVIFKTDIQLSFSCASFISIREEAAGPGHWPQCTGDVIVWAVKEVTQQVSCLYEVLLGSVHLARHDACFDQRESQVSLIFFIFSSTTSRTFCTHSSLKHNVRENLTWCQGCMGWQGERAPLFSSLSGGE